MKSTSAYLKVLLSWESSMRLVLIDFATQLGATEHIMSKGLSDIVFMEIQGKVDNTTPRELQRKLHDPLQGFVASAYLTKTHLERESK